MADSKCPMSVTITAARKDLNEFLSKLQENYMLPPWLLDLVVSSALADIRNVSLHAVAADTLESDEETPDYSKGVVLASKDDMTKQEPTTK